MNKKQGMKALPLFLMALILLVGTASAIDFPWGNYDYPWDSSINATLWDYYGSYSRPYTQCSFWSVTNDTTETNDYIKVTAASSSRSSASGGARCSSIANEYLNQETDDLIERDFNITGQFYTRIYLSSSYDENIVTSAQNYIYVLFDNQSSSTLVYNNGQSSTIDNAFDNTISENLIISFVWNETAVGWEVYENSSYYGSVSAVGKDNATIRFSSYAKSDYRRDQGVSPTLSATADMEIRWFNISQEVVIKEPYNYDTDISFADWIFVPRWTEQYFTSCNLYIDDTFESSNTSSLTKHENNTLAFAYSSQGTHDWYMNCTDGTYFVTSDIWNFTVDITAPQFNITTPNLIDTYLQNSPYAINVTYTDNFDLFNCSYDIYFPNSTLMQTNSTPCSGTSFTWDNNTWTAPFAGVYNFNFSATDSHTDQNWNPNSWWYDDIGLFVEDRAENIIIGNATYGVMWLGGDNKQAPNNCNGNKVEMCHKPGTNAEQTKCVQQNAVDAHLGHGDYLGYCGWQHDQTAGLQIHAEKLNDRIKFSYLFEGDRDEWYQLKVFADESLSYRDNSALTGHFLLNNNNWIDFQDLVDNNFQFRVDEVADNYAIVAFEAPGTGWGEVYADPATGGLLFNSTAINITVYDGTPTANFTIETAAPRWVNAQVQFNDTSTTPVQTELTDWDWTFGDGDTSTTQNATHTYTEPGIYSVGLIVTNNVSSESPEYNQSIIINGFQIDVFDEISGDPIINWDVTVGNTTYSRTFNDQNNTFNWDNFTDFPIGSIRIAISADGYPVRYYYETFADGAPVDLTAYLLGSADGLYTYFLVQDSLTHSIPDALITAEYLVGGNWTEVSTVLTDQTGSASLWLSWTKTYRIIVSKDGYNSVTRNVVPTPTTYIIVLGSGQIFEYEDTNNTIWTQLLPTLTTLDDSSVPITMTVHDPSEGISICGMNFTFVNGTVFQTINSTTEARDCSVTMSPTGLGSEVNFYTIPFFTSNATSDYQWSRLYKLYDGGGTLGSGIEGLDSYLSPEAKLFLAVVIVLFSGAMTAMWLGSGAAMMMLAVGALLFYYGWFGEVWTSSGMGTGMLFIIAFTATVAALFLERRRGY